MNEEQMKYIANLISQNIEKDNEIKDLKKEIFVLKSQLGIDNKYKEVLDKIKEYCNIDTLIDRFYNDKVSFEVIVNELNRLLEEIE